MSGITFTKYEHLLLLSHRICGVLLEYFNNIVCIKSSFRKKKLKIRIYRKDIWGFSMGVGCFLRNIKRIEVREAGSKNRKVHIP